MLALLVAYSGHLRGDSPECPSCASCLSADKLRQRLTEVLINERELTGGQRTCLADWKQRPILADPRGVMDRGLIKSANTADRLVGRRCASLDSNRNCNIQINPKNKCNKPPQLQVSECCQGREHSMTPPTKLCT